MVLAGRNGQIPVTCGQNTDRGPIPVGKSFAAPSGAAEPRFGQFGHGKRGKRLLDRDVDHGWSEL